MFFCGIVIGQILVQQTDVVQHVRGVGVIPPESDQESTINCEIRVGLGWGWVGVRVRVGVERMCGWYERMCEWCDNRMKE